MKTVAELVFFTGDTLVVIVDVFFVQFTGQTFVLSEASLTVSLARGRGITVTWLVLLFLICVVGRGWVNWVGFITLFLKTTIFIDSFITLGFSLVPVSWFGVTFGDSFQGRIEVFC